MEKEALRTENLKKEYNVGGHRIEALKDVNLSIEEGKLVSLIGTSGCGKSTLLHMLGGLDLPTSGNVFINNTNLALCNEKELAHIRRNEIGFVFQDFSLLEELNVYENIMLPLLIDGKKPDKCIFNDFVNKLGLSGRLAHRPSQLSGGQQQRVAIARALINNPSVILCDEPTGNLDKKSTEDVMEFIHRVHEEYNKTVLIVTHDLDVAKGADYILKMEDGRII